MSKQTEALRICDKIRFDGGLPTFIVISLTPNDTEGTDYHAPLAVLDMLLVAK